MSDAVDPFDLQRFVEAQAAVYATVMQELARGAKRSHWMWFVFPQLKGLGRSATAQHYGIGSADEARAYAAHELLGPRLLECTRLVVAVSRKSALEVFGRPDDLKFHSSMTLFASVVAGEVLFAAALQRYFSGTPDAATLDLLNDRGAAPP